MEELLWKRLRNDCPMNQIEKQSNVIRRSVKAHIQGDRKTSTCSLKIDKHKTTASRKLVIHSQNTQYKSKCVCVAYKGVLNVFN